LDAEEWRALEQAGDLDRPDHPVQGGDTYAGGGSAVLAGHLRQTGLDAMLRKHLGRKAGKLVGEMITHQVLRPNSKNAYSASRRQTLGAQ